jgi:energy-coupling factor transport system permease protein
MGQYIAGDTPVHRADARVKILLAVSFSIAVFSVSSWWGFAAISAGIAGVIALSRVPVRSAARGVIPIVWLALFTVAVNVFVWQDPGAAFSVGSVGVSIPGLVRGAFLGVRIVLLVVGTSVVTLTTSPVALTDGIASLMGPLRHLRVPVDDLSMMLSIALRFVPTTAEEADRIVIAQTARGARFDSGGLVMRARAWMPVLVPLFVRLFRRADDLAMAMESRCYTGRARTRLRRLVMRPVDWVALVCGVCAALAVGLLW